MSAIIPSARAWLAGFAVLLFAAPAVAQVQVINVNFSTGDPGAPGGAGPFNLGPTDVAGVVATPNWNNVPSQNTTVPIILNNSLGVPTSATLIATGVNNPWSIGGTPATPNGVMMTGYLDTGNTTTTSVTIDALPATFTTPGYSVYVYFDGNNGTEFRVGQYTIAGQTVYGNDAGVDFTGTFTQVPGSSTTDQGAATPAGNYIVFSGLTAASFTLTATPGTAATGTLRAPINGIQVVPVPEPAHVLLACVTACGGVAAWRRRRIPTA